MQNNNIISVSLLWSSFQEQESPCLFSANEPPYDKQGG